MKEVHRNLGLLYASAALELEPERLIERVDATEAAQPRPRRARHSQSAAWRLTDRRPLCDTVRTKQKSYKPQTVI
jgi:hypothetical protein